MKRKEITKLWRKHGWGRLYWKRSNGHWRNFWDSDDIAAVRNGSASIHFQSFEAILEIIEREKNTHLCEQEGCPQVAFRKYHIYMLDDPDLDLWLCWHHAISYGCCPVCGHHGGYSGMCQQCMMAVIA